MHTAAHAELLLTCPKALTRVKHVPAQGVCCPITWAVVSTLCHSGSDSVSGWWGGTQPKRAPSSAAACTMQVAGLPPDGRAHTQRLCDGAALGGSSRAAAPTTISSSVPSCSIKRRTQRSGSRLSQGTAWQPTTNQPNQQAIAAGAPQGCMPLWRLCALGCCETECRRPVTPGQQQLLYTKRAGGSGCTCTGAA